MAAIPRRLLGNTGLEVSVLGFGASPLGSVFEVSPRHQCRCGGSSTANFNDKGVMEYLCMLIAAAGNQRSRWDSIRARGLSAGYQLL